jgi:hypothetical protein
MNSKVPSAGVDMMDAQSLDVYVPDYEQIRVAAGLSKTALDQDTVTIPTGLFKFLLSAMVERVQFDEETYLKKYADVAAAKKAGKISQLKEHFAGTGWYEGRTPGEYPIDENWYLAKYRDVAVAKRRGLISNPQSHYNETGRSEGRVGSAAQEEWKKRWDVAMGQAKVR